MKREKAEELVWNLLFPRRCPVCDEIAPGGKMICPQCEGKLIRIQGAGCMKCGQPLENVTGEYCYDCSRNRHVYDMGRAVFLYNLPMKQSIYRYKYGNRREYGEFYAEAMLKELGGFITGIKADAIIPIPLHPDRMKKRGYNQTEILGKIISRETGIPMKKNCLVRTKNTVPQKELNEHQRKNNLKNAFKIEENELQLKKILLIDDIYTTGSTIDAAAAALKSKGADKVYYTSISLGRGY